VSHQDDRKSPLEPQGLKHAPKLLAREGVERAEGLV
jgi:hypothetical protein